MSASEVARLLKEIEVSYQAAKHGLQGLAEGTAKHEFITAKMERIEQNRESLIHLIGMEQAMALVVQVLEKPEEGVGFEPTKRAAYRFSKPTQSTTMRPFLAAITASGIEPEPSQALASECYHYIKPQSPPYPGFGPVMGQLFKTRGGSDLRQSGFPF